MQRRARASHPGATTRKKLVSETGGPVDSETGEACLRNRGGLSSCGLLRFVFCSASLPARLYSLCNFLLSLFRVLLFALRVTLASSDLFSFARCALSPHSDGGSPAPPIGGGQWRLVCVGSPVLFVSLSCGVAVGSVAVVVAVVLVVGGVVLVGGYFTFFLEKVAPN